MNRAGILSLTRVAPLCAFLLMRVASATDYFVANNGTNTNTGLSNSSPWQLISHALGEATNSGDVIHVADGAYSERIHISNTITLVGANTYVPSNPPFSRNISRTVIRPMAGSPHNTAVITVLASGVALRSLTLNGDLNTNGTADVAYGVYCTNRPVTIDHCIITNIDGYGIRYEGLIPPPSPGDTDSVRGYLGYNTIADITHTNASQATGILMQQAPATCEFNEFGSINGTNARAGIYVFSCRYTSNMTNGVILDNNYFNDCLVGISANSFGASGEKIHIRGNTVTNGLVGIRISAAEGQALVFSNTISVSGVSSSPAATPARGIWAQADFDPWNTLGPSNQTDHLVLGNRVSGKGTSTNGTAGMLFQYDIAGGNNDGVRATVVSNVIEHFDYGISIKDGTNGALIVHDPMVDVKIHFNNIYSNNTYCLFAAGVTQNVDATSNWWGSYWGPTTNPLTPPAVSANINYVPYAYGRCMTDTDGDGWTDNIDDDDDNDGVWDLDELNFPYYTAPENPDTDGDRSSDWAEIIAGTSPTNALSVFEVFSFAPEPTTNAFRIVWTSVAGRTYTLHATTNLLSGFPTLLTNAAATPPTNTFVDTNMSWTVQLYRVTVTN